MPNRISQYLLLVALLICLGPAFSKSSASAQSPVSERPKLKDFGSSLKRLKWDPKMNAAVRVKRKEEKAKGSVEEEDVLRIETSLVVCDILVLDAQWRPVQGLARDDFVVREEGVPQQIGTFALGDNMTIPRSIVLIIDYSSSQVGFIKTSVEAAKTLVDRLGPRDIMAIVTDDVELLVDFTSDKEKLKKRLESLEKKATSGRSFRERRFGRSAQYSALMATLNEAFDDEDLRPIIIFQTDGDELSLLRDPIITPSIPPNLPPDMQAMWLKNLPRWQQYNREHMREFSLSDIYKAAENSRATIYTVIPGFRLIGREPEEQLELYKADRERHLSAIGMPEVKEDSESSFKRMPVEAIRHWIEERVRVQMALGRVATVTGGWTDYLEEPSQAAAIYSRIFSDINHRYVIGYYPANKEHDGKRRKVSIEVRGHPEYVVWGRKAYYAPGPEN